jgi:hypothetical protein
VRKSFFVWVAKAPGGSLIPDTLGREKRDTQGALFSYIAARDEEYVTECWKRWELGQKRAREMGYRIVRCNVKESSRATGK